MRRELIHTLFLALAALVFIPQTVWGQSRYLVLNFDCNGKAKGQSKDIGNALRNQIRLKGGQSVSRELFEKTLKKKRISESDLNYTVDDLREITINLGADGAAFGHVYTAEDIFTVELRYLDRNGTEPVLFDPIVCGSIEDIYAVIPEMAALILSPDKISPEVLSVDPVDGGNDVKHFVDLKIKFSEPMNPSTVSISGKPERMWKRYGDIVYDNKSNSFLLKLHLYPDIEYEFQINGDDSKGFKDLAGNPARNYIWTFKTSR
ncbi:MAG: Ig-like domain-containing protein [candidate division Zixibacteria bacterium]